MEYIMMQTVENSLEVLKRLGLPYDTAVLLLSIYPNKLETDVQQKLVHEYSLQLFSQ